MRVLVTTAQRAVVGGVETYLRAVLPMLQHRGLEVGVMTAYPAAGQATIVDGCHDVPAWTAAGPAEAVRVAADFRPDVVFTHDLPDPSADAALADHYPVVRYAHNYAGGCVSGTKCHAAPDWQPCRRQLGPGCLVAYLPRRCGGLNPLSALRQYGENRQRQHTLARLRAVLVASRHMADEVIRNGAPADRVHLVPLFPPEVSPDPGPPAPRRFTDRVLFVGRITGLKGWRELAEAVRFATSALGRRLTLVVVGDGPDREAFEAEVRRRGLPTEFLGWLGRTSVSSQMRQADVLIVPSVWPEPFGLIGIEGGCVGLPAVGFATGGIPEWLIPGVSGESAPGERPRADQLAEALVRALADVNHWQRLRVGAWDSAQRFTADAHLHHLLPRLLAARG